jgi:hypothetical protein
MSSFLKKNGRKVSYSNEVWKVVLEDGTEAIFKTSKDGDLSRNDMEETAFDFSVHTKLAYLPPIVLRSVKLPGASKSKLGFLSVFVETNIDAVALTLKEFEAWINSVDEPARSNYKVFNYVFGNWDIGSDNTLLLERKNGDKAQRFIIAIDNNCLINLQKVKYGELQFARYYYLYDDDTQEADPFPFEQSKECDESARQMILKKYGRRITKREHNYVIFNGDYWAQFYGMDYYKFMLYPESIPEETVQTLKGLKREQLREIMARKHNMDQRREAIVDGILERRDSMLEHFGA